MSTDHTKSRPEWALPYEQRVRWSARRDLLAANPHLSVFLDGEHDCKGQAGTDGILLELSYDDAGRWAPTDAFLCLLCHRIGVPWPSHWPAPPQPAGALGHVAGAGREPRT